MSLSKITLLSLVAIAASAPAYGCDLCGCYTPTLEVVHVNPYSFYGGATEQFTHFGTERRDGEKQSNPFGEHIDSSISQFVLGASFLDNRIGVQVSLPVIYRSYQRVLGFKVDRGHDFGIGDIPITLNVIALRKEALFHDEPAGYSKDGKTVLPPHRGEADFSAIVNLTAGIKLPSGDTSHLKENYAPGVDGGPDSGIGPHDLTLGTGSVDGIFGVQAEVRYKALFFQADAQYTVRGYGTYQYRFANDLSWSGGPGVYLYRREGRSLSLQCVVSGETKGLDHFQGVADPDSGVTALYVGPRVIASFGKVNGEVGVDLPAIMNTTAYQTAADYRIRAGFTVHF